MRVPFNGRIVLVVEDDWFVREDISDQFRREGWMVLEAATGAKALELLRKGQRIDVLVTDITLADAITGWDVAEAVRILYPEVPVIYASGGPDNQGRRVLNGVSLSKPLTAHDLLLACSKLRSTGPLPTLERSPYGFAEDQTGIGSPHSVL
jgi:CheY-like chemotaxis protein